MTRLSILNVGIFAVFVSCAHAQTVPVVPAVRDGFRRMMDDNRRRMNRLRDRDILEV